MYVDTKSAHNHNTDTTPGLIFLFELEKTPFFAIHAYDITFQRNRRRGPKLPIFQIKKNKTMAPRSTPVAPEAAPSTRTVVPTMPPDALQLEDSSQSAERSCSHDTSEDDKSTTRNTSKGEGEGSSSASSSRLRIGKAETTAVNRSKMLVFLCLACFSVATAVATWYIVTTEETNDFVVAVRLNDHGQRPHETWII